MEFMNIFAFIRCWLTGDWLIERKIAKWKQTKESPIAYDNEPVRNKQYKVSYWTRWRVVHVCMASMQPNQIDNNLTFLLG